MLVAQRAHHAVLNWIDVLELVDDNRVPSPPDRGSLLRLLEQLRRLDDERIEIDELAFREKTLIAVEQDGVVVLQWVVAESMRREQIQRVLVPAPRTLESPQHAELILLVGDAEPRLEQHVNAQLAQQLRAEGVNRPALELRDTLAEPGLEAMLDFAGRFVRECERANARGIDALDLDQPTDALGEAEGLARAGTREDQTRARGTFDRFPLRRRRDVDAVSGADRELGRGDGRQYRTLLEAMRLAF